MSKENPPGITLVIRGARLLDPASPEAKPPARDIFISGTRIESVTPPGEVETMILIGLWLAQRANL